MARKKWLCIECGLELGQIEGGELRPAVHGSHTITRGPNLLVECPDCGFKKVFYTADPIVRAMYQLIDAMSDGMANRMLFLLADKINGSNMSEELAEKVLKKILVEVRE